MPRMTSTSLCRSVVSKIFTPTDQAFSSTSSAHTGDPSDADTGAPTLTPLPNRGVGRVTVNLTGTVNSNADADPGIGNSANATAWIEWNKPSVGWVTIDTISSSASNGSSDSDGPGSGPYVVDVTDVNNLNDIEARFRCRTAANSTNDATSDATASITAWTITVNLKSSGILAA